MVGGVSGAAVLPEYGAHDGAAGAHVHAHTASAVGLCAAGADGAHTDFEPQLFHRGIFPAVQGCAQYGLAGGAGRGGGAGVQPDRDGPAGGGKGHGYAGPVLRVGGHDIGTGDGGQVPGGALQGQDDRGHHRPAGAGAGVRRGAPGRQGGHRPHRGHQGRRDGHRPAGGAYPRGRHCDGGQRHRGRVRPYRREYAGGEGCGRQGGVRHHPDWRLSGADGGPGRCGYHSVPDHSADGAGRQRQGTYQPSGG